MGFEFNGKSSNDLAVKTIKAPILAAPRYEEVEIPGRDGAYKFFQGYKSSEAILEITVVGELHARQAKVKEIKDWLKGTGTLKIDYCDAFEATVTNLDSSNFENSTEVIRVTFKSGSSAGSSIPGGTGSAYDDTALKERITAIEEKNTLQDTEIGARRKTADKIAEDDLTEDLKTKLGTGSAVGNIDGGYPGSVYGGLDIIDGGGI